MLKAPYGTLHSSTVQRLLGLLCIPAVFIAPPALAQDEPSDSVRETVEKSDGDAGSDNAQATPEARPAVEVLSRKIVGSFDVAVVRENEAGALNGWLQENGFQQLDGADDVLDFYRRKKYVYACVKVSEAQ